MAKDIRARNSRIYARLKADGAFQSWLTARNATTNGGTRTPMDWSAFYNDKRLNGSKAIKSVRSEIASIQGNACCYCQGILQNTGHAKPIDHILPRESYVNLTYEVTNLAVACFDCNHEKGADRWTEAIQQDVTRAPISGDEYGFFHPNLHEYEEHIDNFSVTKGSVTVRTFKGKSPIGDKLCVDLLHKICDDSRKVPKTIRVAIELLESVLSNEAIDESERDACETALRELLKTIPR